jgi:hypothetical protein
MNDIEEHTELLDASTKVGLEADPEKTKYMLVSLPTGRWVKIIA